MSRSKRLRKKIKLRRHGRWLITIKRDGYYFSGPKP